MRVDKQPCVAAGMDMGGCRRVKQRCEPNLCWKRAPAPLACLWLQEPSGTWDQELQAMTPATLGRVLKASPTVG